MYDILKRCPIHHQHNNGTTHVKYDKNKISKNGDVIIVAQSHRTQNKNKIDAINRLESLFSDIKIPIKRIPTKPSWSSQVKRVESKKKRSVLKRNRKKVMLDE